MVISHVCLINPAHAMEAKEAAVLSLVRSDLASVNYKGVESIETIAKEIGLSVSELVKLGLTNWRQNSFWFNRRCERERIRNTGRGEERNFGRVPEVAHLPRPFSSNFAQCSHRISSSNAFRVQCRLWSWWDFLNLTHFIVEDFKITGSDDLLDIVIRLFDPRHIIISTPT